MGKVRITAAGNVPLCEVCDSPLTDEDVDDDGYTTPAECGRVGLCDFCRACVNHDHDDEPTETRS